MIAGLRQGKPAFLASVTSADEADVALAGGADIIDCKDPAAGALGALSPQTVRAVVERVRGRLPVSATVGDLPSDPGVLTDAVAAMATTGVDVVKIGFFGDSDPRPAISALSAAQSGSAELVAVLMADRSPDFALVPMLAAAGFAGAMLDTADKTAGRLTSALCFGRLSEFVRVVRENELFVGLAGSLQEGDIAGLASLEPDMLGFRGALCSAGRVGAIDGRLVALIRRRIDEARFVQAARETSVA